MRKQNIITWLVFIVTIMVITVLLLTVFRPIADKKSEPHESTQLEKKQSQLVVDEPQSPPIPVAEQIPPSQTKNKPATVADLTGTFKSVTFSDKKRSEALGKLYATRMEMADAELLGFWEALLRVAEKQDLSTQFHSDTLWVLNEIGVLLRHKGLLNSGTIEEQVGFLVHVSTDVNQELTVRRMAITALGDLQVSNAVPMLSELLADKRNWDTPELARSASIALSRLDPKQAFKPVTSVLSNTTNSAVFGSAAYSLREMDSPEVLAVLVNNRNRLNDNLSVDNTVRKLFPMITNILANPSSPHISSAIDATQSIGQENQRTTVIELLSSVVKNSLAMSTVRQQALNRLLDISKILHREERHELLSQLDAMTTDPIFSENKKQIQRERNVQVLVPVVELE